jgi:hypothetical protein
VFRRPRLAEISSWSRKEWAEVATIVAVPIAIIGIVASLYRPENPTSNYPSSSSSSSTTGRPAKTGTTGPAGLAGDQLSVLTSHSYYRLQFAINNPTSVEHLINRVELAIHLIFWNVCDGPPATVYRVNDSVKASYVTDRIKFAGAARALADSEQLGRDQEEFFSSLKGEASYSCSRTNLSFLFQPTVVLKKNQISIFAIDLPKMLRATYQESASQDEGLQQRYINVVLPEGNTRSSLSVRSGSIAVRANISVRMFVAGQATPLRVCKRMDARTLSSDGANGQNC